MSKAEVKSGKKARKKLAYEKRKALYGYGFIGLWMIGTLFFFLIPLVKSFWYSFNEVSIGEGKMITDFVGIDKFDYVLTVDENYADYLKDTLLETLWKTPLIIIFSLFIAVILNQKFKGRTFARAIFFLPVIIATGPVYKIINGDMDSTGNTGAGQFSTMFSTDLVGELMQFLGIYGLSDNMSTLIQTVADNIFGIVWSAGIQILIFLAALQNIPPSAKEAAQMEGATAWEYFWKITFPYVSPFILANLIFTVIDSFTSPTNKVMGRILDMKEDWKFGEASAMAWIYFGIVLIAIAIVSAIVNKFIYYEVD
ncbi:MAG: sugar ABC transporter permease [Ruminococcus sp.]|nr:sugar ABC transporter permease [Ruminococcus sp.]MBR6792649.1 sugar ABC transporter permease [Ruminococcus sp.]